MPAIRFATLIIGVLWMAACVAAWGQLAGQGEQGGHAFAPYYNIKAGPVYLTLSSGITTEYTDNINLSNGTTTPIRSELTINPHFGIDALSQLQVTPLSETNVSTLSLRMNFGYRDYVFHSQLNQNVSDINIAPDSELSFLIRAGDYIKIRVHDGFGLESDPASNGSLSNVAQFRRFTNTFGVDNRWEMNSNTAFELDYAHRNVYALDLIALGSSGTTTSLNTSAYTNASDSLTALAQTKALSPRLTLGLRGSVTGTEFPGAPGQNTTTYSYGPFADLQLTQYTSLRASWGISSSRGGDVFTGGTATALAGTAPDTSTQYADLSLINRLNTYYSQTFSVGRETALSLLGSQMQSNYMRYQGAWKVNSKISLTIGLFTDDTTDLAVAGTGGHYSRYGGSLGTGLALSKKLSTTLDYRYIKKNSDDPLQSYQQNTLTWSLDYRF
ncbi:MAG: hypothetical protein WCH57_09275 [Verrucomicrobiota bacterium]